MNVSESPNGCHHLASTSVKQYGQRNTRICVGTMGVERYFFYKMYRIWSCSETVSLPLFEYMLVMYLCTTVVCVCVCTHEMCVCERTWCACALVYVHWLCVCACGVCAYPQALHLHREDPEPWVARHVPPQTPFSSCPLAHESTWPGLCPLSLRPSSPSAPVHAVGPAGGSDFGHNTCQSA